eukprot:3125955-Rhodomonas_salina.3
MRSFPSVCQLFPMSLRIFDTDLFYAEQNEKLSKRLSALSDVPSDVWSKTAQIPYDGSADLRPMMLVHQKHPVSNEILQKIEWDLDYLHKYVERSSALAWSDETKTRLKLYDGSIPSSQSTPDMSPMVVDSPGPSLAGADFGFGIEQNDNWFGDPRVVELLLDLHARYPGRVNLVR